MLGPSRVILHLDMDAFYAAVEVRENPGLAGKPLIIGHRGPRGVVSTCSYEARKYGVHSAMPSVTAERLCPGGVWLPGRMELYVRVSLAIRQLLAHASPVVEPLSIDEAFLDLTGLAADLAQGKEKAAALKEEIQQAERLTASVGVAPNKFLAKLASDMEKPDGLVVFPLADVATRLWPLPIKRLWGVGPRTEERLHRLAIRKVGDLLKISFATLESRLGSSMAGHLTSLARGEDDRPVETHRPTKSISEERTYTVDLTRSEQIDRALLARSEGVARELRRKGLVARTVHIKVRTGDFTTWTRGRTLSAASDLTEVLVDTARRLLARKIDLGGRGVRLLGVGVSGLQPRASGQGALPLDPAQDRARRLAKATDLVRKRYGDDAVTRARLGPRRRAAEDDDLPEGSSLPSVD